MAVSLAVNEASVTVTQAKRDRNRTVRRRRSRGLSQRELARLFGVSRPRIQQILRETGGDPLADRRLAHMTEAELERERDRLTDRIGSDLRRLMVVDDELVVRGHDRLLGL